MAWEKRGEDKRQRAGEIEGWMETGMEGIVKELMEKKGWQRRKGIREDHGVRQNKEGEKCR